MTFNNYILKLIGIGFLGIGKAKSIVKGYSSPKPFNTSQTTRCIDYDIAVVEHWLTHLEKYSKRSNSIIGKRILELGPGSDLGIGLYLLSLGCSRYYALDANNLMKGTSDYFYDKMLEKIQSKNKAVDICSLRSELFQVRSGLPSKINYKVRKDFDIVAAFGNSTIDLVFSQAAFEHFDDISVTFSKLTKACKPGAIIVAEIDLKSHSRWIRESDPNNIYRFSDQIYKFFKYSGIPNRVRPYRYKEILEKLGWVDIRITPLEKFHNLDLAYSGLSKAFIDRKNQMELLSFMLCARKKIESGASG